MINALVKSCLLIMLIVSLFAQPLSAFAMACETQQHGSHAQSKSATASQHHAGMMHHDSSTQAAQAMAMDCCDDECYCPMSACSSIFYLFQASLNIELLEFVDAAINWPARQPIAGQMSLYRPPIFA